MKGLSDQRRLYGLAAVLLILTVAVCCVWGLWGRPSDTTDATAGSPVVAIPTAVSPSEDTASVAAVPEASAAPEAVVDDAISTVVYYQDNNQYLVPVMKRVKNEPGIAKATLTMMIQNPINDREAARLGLRTIIPEGTEIDLDIAEGVARIDLSKEAATLPDAAAETNMVSAIVQTLTEFPTVDTVRFLIDGREVDQLQHGVSLAGDFHRGYVNLESPEDGLTPGDAQTITLYFAGETGSVIVPVTRMIYGNADVETAVLELVKGPSAQSPLDNALPADCGLISVTNTDGHVVVDFTKEFMQLIEGNDGGRQALRALALTCSQFSGVRSVEVRVEGEPYDVGAETLAIPTFVNIADSITDPFLQAQADAILE